MKTTRITSGALLAATFTAAILLATGSASATEGVFVSSASRLNPAAVTTEGEGATYANLDADLHTVTSVALKPNGKPLFDSGPVAAGEIVQVTGVEKLDSGNYEYYCIYHSTMRGTLVVTELLSPTA